MWKLLFELGGQTGACFFDRETNKIGRKKMNMSKPWGGARQPITSIWFGFWFLPVCEFSTVYIPKSLPEEKKKKKKKRKEKKKLKLYTNTPSVDNWRLFFKKNNANTTKHSLLFIFPN